MTDTTNTADDLHLRVEDGIATITFDRPDAGNAITHDQRERFLGWMADFDDDPSVRCVVIEATGRFFCTGADLRQPGNPAAERLVGDVRRTMLRGAVRLVNTVLDSEKPVVAKVQGTAAGIGAHLAFACDLVVVAESAKFVEVFARRGLVADGLGTWLLPRLIGLQRAKELILLAEDVPAPRALELGLATRVVPDEELDGTVAELARRLAAGPTKAHAANKFLLNRSLDLGRDAMAHQEAWIVDAQSHTEDASEGVAAFVERRPPEFQGR